MTAAYLATQHYRVKVAPGRLEREMAHTDWNANPQAAAQARERIVNPRGVVKMFDLDAEGNLPTIYSAVQLVVAARLLFLIALHHRAIQSRDFWLWLLLACGFIFLAMDEGGSLHSSMYLSVENESVRKTRGIFYFSWIIPASILVCAVGLLYVRFLWRLPGATRALFLLTGFWYVGSAVGGEMMQGWWTAQGYNKLRFGWVAMTLIEEIGEMLAIALFITALLNYMRRERIVVLLAVAGTLRPAVMASKSAAIEPITPAAAPTLEPDHDDLAGVLPR